MNTIQQTLTKAKQLIETHGWIREDYGNENVGFCAYGALIRAGGPIYMAAYPYLKKAIGRNINIVYWNDADGRTKDEVLTAFDRAIELAAGDGNE